MTCEMTRLNANNNSHNQIESKTFHNRGKTKYITVKEVIANMSFGKKQEKHENRDTPIQGKQCTWGELC